MLEEIILGILQGVFEWLPISSEGIVAITSSLFGEEDAVNYALFLHGGTMLAVIVYFYKDWMDVFTLKDEELLKFLFIATLISLPVGYILHSAVTSVTVGASLLLLTGAGLFATAHLHRKKKKMELTDDQATLLAGILQGLAVIPGFSRSGATFFGLSTTDWKPEKILKYSYMMSVPAVAASTAFLLTTEPTITDGWLALAVSFLVGLLSLKYIMKMSKKIDFYPVAIVFGTICVIGAIIGYAL